MDIVRHSYKFKLTIPLLKAIARFLVKQQNLFPTHSDF